MGKTTTVCALCGVFASRGKKVLAIDLDPSRNFSDALGFMKNYFRNSLRLKTTLEDDDADALLDAAIELVVDMGQASASMLQRRFKIGYSRAGRIVDQMEARGIVSGYEGSKPRQVLISKEEWEELKMGTLPQTIEE